jgi:uncharacterized glyoxalase superfamily protein PhnB
MPSPTVRKSTPVLFVAAIEPSLPFWQERLGFERTVEVPGDAGLAFAILRKGEVELMYQTVASLQQDSAAHAVHYDGDRSFLFVEVDDIGALAAALDGCEIVMPRRETFYGSTEIGYREPGGHFVTFAQFPPR